MERHLTLRVAITAAIVVALATCGGTSDPVTAPSGIASPTATAPRPAAPRPAVPAPAPALGATALEIVTTLAADELAGRDNLTAESVIAQEFLIDQLELFADPAAAGLGRDGYRIDFDQGTNLIGVIHGTDLADEYVLVGAHYDHVGGRCRGVSDTDRICNGAADNAAGVAAAIEVGRALADAQPRRSVIIALWDSEEDGLLGARQYVLDPVIPLDQIVVNLNFDIQGANLSPALSGSTFIIGAETGGEHLIAATHAASDVSPLETINFNLIFGQGRSDHAPFAAATVPIVFFTDATNGCYHTVSDDLDALDAPKLSHQVDTAIRLALDLADNDTPPQFDAGAPVTNFDDAVNLLQVVAALEPDFPLLGPDGATETADLLVAVEAIVAAGPEGYDGSAAGTVLRGISVLIERLAEAWCFPA